MFRLLFKILILFVILILVINHWDIVMAFFNGIIDWLVYWMKAASVGPPEIIETP